MIQRILVVVVALFPLSEVVLALMKRSSRRTAQGEDQGSMGLLWLSIACGLGLAIAAQWLPALRLPGSPQLLRLLALGFLAGGLALRWAAILSLGRFFTVDVAIHADHVVLQEGLYRLVRHPSYTGLLLAFLGLGLFFANWLSVLGLMLPIAFAVHHRVQKEEGALLASLGAEYASYCARTRRFIPGLL